MQYDIAEERQMFPISNCPKYTQIKYRIQNMNGTYGTDLVDYVIAVYLKDEDTKIQFVDKDDYVPRKHDKHFMLAVQVVQMIRYFGKTDVKLIYENIHSLAYLGTKRSIE